MSANCDEEFVKQILASDFGKFVGEEVCREILQLAEKRSFPSGTMVFQEGDEPAGIWWTCSGIVKLARISPDGRENILTFVEPPGLFAEAAIFLGGYPATAVTLADSELLLLRRQHVFDLIRRHETFLRFLFTHMARWMQRLVAKIDQLTLIDGTARVARYLLSQLDKEKPHLDYKIPRVTLPATKGDVATLLNMNQPSLSRIFRRLQDENIIDVQARTIFLNDLTALRNLTLPPLD